MKHQQLTAYVTPHQVTINTLIILDLPNEVDEAMDINELRIENGWIERNGRFCSKTKNDEIIQVRYAA